MIFELLLIALVITLEPIPLTAFILVLASEGGVRKGAAFIFGWLLSLAAVVALTVVATGNNPPKPNTQPSLAALALKILIGLVLVVIGLRRRARLGRPKKPKSPPKWQTGIDNMSPWVVIGLGPLTQPWGLVAAGVATIMEAKLSLVGELHRLAAVLPGGNRCLSGDGDLRRLSGRTGQGHHGRGQDLDRHAHGPGHHHPLSRPRILAGWEEHLPARCVGRAGLGAGVTRAWSGVHRRRCWRRRSPGHAARAVG